MCYYCYRKNIGKLRVGLRVRSQAFKGVVFTSPRGKGGNVSAAVTAIVKPIAEQLGYDLWDVRFVKEGATKYLRIIIDKPDGIGIDDCVAMSHAVDDPLDEADPIDESYCLEVSSPGMNRELTRPEHFDKLKGRSVFTRLYRPLDNGERELHGRLLDHDQNCFTIETADHTYVLSRKDVSWVKLDDSDEYGL